jgi:multicomponent Na+:H+ antiporter subunit B
VSRRARFLVFAVGLAGVLALLVAAAPGMPSFGGASHPYRDRAVAEALARHTANAVSSVNFDQRALDTLGEEVILLASVLAASVLLRPARDERVRAPSSAPALPTTALLGYLLLPVTLLIGLDVVTHGAVTPGGGFQGGVVLATGIHLLYLAGSYPALQRVGPDRWAPAVEALGVGGFALVGLAALVGGGAFLANVLPTGTLGDTLSAGTVGLLNVAVGVAVFGSVVELLARFLRQGEALEPATDGRGDR